MIGVDSLSVFTTDEKLLSTVSTPLLPHCVSPQEA